MKINNIDNAEIVSTVVVGVAVIIAVCSTMLSLAEFASRPVVHPASYAVLTSPDLLPIYADQSCATQVCRNGLDSDHLLSEVIR